MSCDFSHLITTLVVTFGKGPAPWPTVQPEWDNGRKPAGHHHRRLCPRCAHPRSRGDGGRCHRARGSGRVLQVWARRCHRWSFLILSKSSVWSPLALWLDIAGVHWAQVQVWPKKTLKVAQQTKPKESVSSAFFLLLCFLLLVVLLLVEEGGLLLDRLLPGPPLRLAGALPPWHQAAHHSRAGQSMEFKTGIELKSRPGVGIFLLMWSRTSQFIFTFKELTWWTINIVQQW